MSIFRVRPLEEVFDHRVAASLRRLSPATAMQVRALADRIDRLTAQIDELRRLRSRRHR